MVLTVSWSIGWASRSTSGGVPTVIAVVLPSSASTNHSWHFWSIRLAIAGRPVVPEKSVRRARPLFGLRACVGLVRLLRRLAPRRQRGRAARLGARLPARRHL